ncbi:MAG TPA: DnaJ domain-containing protein [Bryobacteraceae bacterium]|nr:DnaJ domain-containing protein [Bryobacteraceae bacterium]
MSAPVSGKFQDHYIVLGIEPKADSETIQAAYGKLAQEYHPNNPETGNREKFDGVNLAYEILSDPSLRIEFDKLKGIDHDAGDPKFTGVDFFDALEQGTALRSALLCILYDRRRTRSFKPSLSMRHLEGMLHVTAEELNFALWYLKQRGLVLSDDKSSLQITVVGMDYLEQNRPSAEAVMPLIKPEALSQPKPQPHPQPEKLPAAEAKTSEPVLNVLNRALQSYVPEESPAASTK